MTGRSTALRSLCHVSLVFPSIAPHSPLNSFCKNENVMFVVLLAFCKGQEDK